MPTTDPTTREATPDQRSLIDALVRASFLLTAVLSTVAAEHDLSLTLLRVGGILRDRQAKMSELAAYLGLDRSTISTLVDRAEKRGLMQRTPNPEDGRGIDVKLTPAGIALSDQIAVQVQDVLSPITAALTPAEARRATALLERMLEAEASIPR
jgi:DNA-binding MarR family transcriptional regulator